jgi:hypothetical protein
MSKKESWVHLSKVPCEGCNELVRPIDLDKRFGPWLCDDCRKDRKAAACDHCNQEKSCTKFQANPFIAEIYGEIQMEWICDDCYYQSQMDI